MIPHPFRTIGFCILLLLALKTRAQNLRNEFMKLQASDGLPNNTVFAITQDTMGFMWIGTYEGLSRFDSQKIRNYVNDPKDPNSLSNNAVTALLSDRSGRLWVGTDVGLNLYNQHRDNFQRFFPLTTQQRDRRQKIRSLYEDSRGILWVGTPDGLYTLNPKRDRRLQPVLLPSEFGVDEHAYAFTGACEGANRMIWAARRQSLYEMGTLSHKPGDTVVKWAELTDDDFITAMAMDSNQVIWLGSRRGRIGCFDTRRKVFREPPFVLMQVNDLTVNTVLSIHVGRDGIIRIGAGSGLTTWEPKAKKLTHLVSNSKDEKSLADNFIYAIFQKPDGALWLGTYASGVNYQLPNQQHFYMVGGTDPNTNLSNNMVTSVGSYKTNNLYIGTSGGGLNIVDYHSKKAVHSKKPVAKNVTTMIVKENGDVWIAGDLGLNFYSKASDSWKFFSFDTGNGSIRKRYTPSKISEDDQGKIWIGAHEGLVLFDPLTGIFKDVPIEKKKPGVQTLFKDSHGNLWVGGSPEILCLITNQGSKITKVPIRWEKNQDPRRGSIFAITEDLNGTIWAGGFNLGLLKYNRQKHYFEEFNCQGLFKAARHVANIEADNLNRLWISTFYELCIVEPVTKKVIRFGRADDIYADEFSPDCSHKDQNGQLYFGTNKGLIYFNPNETRFDTVPPRMLLTGLEVNGKIVNAGDSTGILDENITSARQIVLDHDQNFLKLNFALLDFSHPEKDLFAYKLEGVNRDWIYSKDPYVAFNNLAPGSYTLLLKGSNSSGTWVKQPLKFSIVVRPPLWKTWWAFLIYAIVTGAVILLIARLWWIRGTLRRNIALNQSKVDFFTNLSHEIRTNLTLILAPLDKSMSLLDGYSPAKEGLQYTKEGANRLLRLVTELLDFGRIENADLKLNIQKTNLVHLVREMLSVYAHVFEEKGLTARLICKEEEIFAYLDSYQIQKVLSNLIANACKFTHQGGWIEIELLAADNDISISVSDNGRGISPGSLDKIFVNYFQEYDYQDRNTGYGIGLALSKKIIELHQGTLTAMNRASIESGESGARFVISLPRKGAFVPQHVAAPAADAAQPSEEHPEASAVSPELIPHEEAQRYTVLIAEDNIDLRRFLAGSLSEQYQVIECSDGEQAFNEVLSTLPDIVLTDVMMPGVNGIELCNLIKQDERTNHIPVIILTARTAEADIEAGLNAKADHYITKPFSFTELSLRVRNLLAFRNTLRAKFSNSLYSTEFKLDTATNNDEKFTKKLITIVEANMHAEHFGVEHLAREIGMSRTILYKKIKAVTGMSVNDFTKNIKISRAAELLKSEACSVNEVADRVGFSDSRYFSKEFRRIYGVLPSEYTRQHRPHPKSSPSAG